MSRNTVINNQEGKESTEESDITFEMELEKCDLTGWRHITETTRPCMVQFNSLADKSMNPLAFLRTALDSTSLPLC